MKTCDLCLSPLELETPGGRTVIFQAHTPDYCAMATAYRMKILEATATQARIQAEAMLAELRRLHDDNARVRRNTLVVRDGLERIVSRSRSGEEYSSDALIKQMSRMLFELVNPEIDPNAKIDPNVKIARLLVDHDHARRSVDFPDDFGVHFADVKTSAGKPDALRERSGEIPYRPRPADRPIDQHHSQGVEVAEILAGTPLAVECPVCGALPKAPCTGISAGSFHPARVPHS